MEIVFDINVDANGNSKVTQTNGQAGGGLKFTFKASGPKGAGSVIVFEPGSPQELKPGVPHPLPCTLVPLEQPPQPKKVRHFHCGQLVNGSFSSWGAPKGVQRSGGDTPPIGGGN
jgi:hypothetical protein